MYVCIPKIFKPKFEGSIRVKRTEQNGGVLPCEYTIKNVTA